MGFVFLAFLHIFFICTPKILGQSKLKLLNENRLSIEITKVVGLISKHQLILLMKMVNKKMVTKHLIFHKT